MILNIRAASRKDRKKARRGKAWLNGIEVTRECFYADSKRGIVRAFARDAEGHFYVGADGEVAMAERRGKVTLQAR